RRKRVGAEVQTIDDASGERAGERQRGPAVAVDQRRRAVDGGRDERRDNGTDEERQEHQNRRPSVPANDRVVPPRRRGTDGRRRAEHDRRQLRLASTAPLHSPPTPTPPSEAAHIEGTAGGVSNSSGEPAARRIAGPDVRTGPNRPQPPR